MKNKILYFILLLLTSFSLQATVLSSDKTTATKQPTISDMANISKTDMENALGRKLTWRERLGMKAMQYQLRKALAKDPQLSSSPFPVPSTGCAKLVYKNGNVVEADIATIAVNEVKYRRCGKPSDPEMAESKSNLISVVAEDGTVLWRNDGSSDNGNGSNTGNNNSQPQIHYSAIVAFVYGVGGSLLIAVLPIYLLIVLGICGIISGILALNKIKKEPKKYSGKTLAIVGIVFSGLLLLGAIGLLAIFASV